MKAFVVNFTPMEPPMPALQLLLPESATSEAASDCAPPEVASNGDSCAVACIANGGGCSCNSVTCYRCWPVMALDGVDGEPSDLPGCVDVLCSGRVSGSAEHVQALTGNEKRKGRRLVHASAAARKAAYRAQKARIDYTDKPAIAATLEEIAAELDCSKNELMQSLVRFALTNRNWKRVGLYGVRRDGVLQ